MSEPSGPPAGLPPPPEWYDVFCAGTSIGTSRWEAARWWAHGISARAAAAWARFGFDVVTAIPWMAQGVPPDIAAYLRDLETAEPGGAAEEWNTEPPKQPPGG